MKVGWVGVGKMGLPMASHLLAAGHAVAACDLVPALVDAAVARGARIAATPAAAAREAEVVFSSIPDDCAALYSVGNRPPPRDLGGVRGYEHRIGRGVR
jgi:3-hydroxyisobutyrate dehydrogenase-like beta-hydroxyacid dehydrogenase